MSQWGANMELQLTFCNFSLSRGARDVLLFAKNETGNSQDHPIAWKVIRNCAYGMSHPFRYSLDFSIAVGDAHGNFSPKVNVGGTNRFSVELSNGRRGVVPFASTPESSSIEVLNNLSQDVVSINLFSSNLLIAKKSRIAPAMKAVFTLRPELWIGLASQVAQGAAIRSEVIGGVRQKIDLNGISSSEIWMTGGGVGATAQPFAFSLQNQDPC